jgi:glycosyltransferase involved in cell wall biosynthesis
VVENPYDVKLPGIPKLDRRSSRVLFIASQPFFQWRGSPIRVGFNVRALAELGYEVDLLALPFGEKKDIPGTRILRVPNLFFARNIRIGPSLMKAAFDVLIFFQALLLTWRHHYRVLHCVEDVAVVGVVIAAMTGTRLIFEKHSDPGSYKGGFLRNVVMRLYAAAERFAIRHSDAAIGTGQGLVDQIRQVGAGKPVYHISDIPSSMEEATPQNTESIRKRLAQRADEVLVTYAGSFAAYQGVDLMFKAIPAVAGAHPEARFVIIGGTETEIAERKRELAANGVGNAVTFVGKVPPEELPNWLCASDILLSPRLSGVNTPLKLLDYLKAGRAIVATNVEANRLILDDKTAVLVEPDARALAEGIGRLLSDSALRMTLGRDGRALMDRTYNYPKFRAKLDECYQGVIAG